MNIFIIIVSSFVGIGILTAIILIVLSKINKTNSSGQDNNKYLEDLSRRLDNLTQNFETRVNELNENVSNKLTQNIKTNSEQTEKIDSKINDLKENIDSKLKENLKTNNENASRNLETFTEQYRETKTLIKDITEKLKDVESTSNAVKGTQEELKNLHKVLTNPKQRGNFGERQLGVILSSVFSPTQYKEQYKFNDGTIVDAVLFLRDNLIVPIDSKFSLENYNNYLDSDSDAERNNYAGVLKMDLQARIDETSKYIKPTENTTEFAFMFIPSESLYYDLLINKIAEKTTSERDLIEYAFSKNVIIVSPTTLIAYLSTVTMGLKNMQIEEQAKGIRDKVLKLEIQLKKFEDSYSSLGGSLSTVVNKYNDTYKVANRIGKESTKITSNENPIDPTLIDKPSRNEE